MLNKMFYMSEEDFEIIKIYGMNNRMSISRIIRESIKEYIDRHGLIEANATINIKPSEGIEKMSYYEQQRANILDTEINKLQQAGKIINVKFFKSFLSANGILAGMSAIAIGRALRRRKWVLRQNWVDGKRYWYPPKVWLTVSERIYPEKKQLT